MGGRDVAGGDANRLPVTRGEAPLNSARVLLPADVAQGLVDDRAAVRPYEIRGIGDELIRVAVDDVNAAASVVTVFVAAGAVRKFAARLWARLRKGEDEVVTVTISVPGAAEPYELKVRRDDEAGQDKVLDFLIKLFPVENG
jgi:hypothetical protein